MSRPAAEAAASPRRGEPPWGLAACLALVLVVAFAFQGSRGIWEPDEGRYVHAALEMQRSGDWLVPRLHGLAYLDKPPAVYWAIALGMRVFGTNEWGARLPHALALIATALLMAVWLRPRLGRRWAALAAGVYGTTLMPMVAATVVTPDGLLSLCTTASLLAYWRWRDAGTASRRWLWAGALGLAVGAGLFTKGTAALIFAAPIGVHALVEQGPGGLLRKLELWLAAILAMVVGFAWYLKIGVELPGALGYFFDNQVAGRLWKSSYDRNAQWWKALRIYAVALVAGSLPWCLLWPALARRMGVRRLRDGLAGDDLARFLVLASALPLAVLLVARSRLELYLLPALAPLVALTVLAVERSGLVVAWRRSLLAAATCLIVLKLVASWLPSSRDSARLARQLSEAVPPEACLHVLDAKVHGLSLYGFRRVFWNSTYDDHYPYFEPPSSLASTLGSPAQRCGGERFALGKRRHEEAMRAFFAAAGWRCLRQEEASESDFTLLRCRKTTDPSRLAGEG